MRAKDALGRYGERVAAAHLSRSGMAILASNWRCGDGELDLVARDGETIVFCEVKTRSGRRYGAASEAIGPVKAARVRRLAMQWLTQTRIEAGGPFWPNLRFDVVSVYPQRAGAARVDHIRGAF